MISRFIGLLTITVALIISLSGCYAGYLLEMDGLEPAKETIPGSVQSLTLVARQDLDSTYKANWNKSVLFSSFEKDSILNKEPWNGCWDALLESPRFEIRNPVVTRNLAVYDRNPGVLLPWPKIVEIAGNPAVDAVLSLESCEFSDSCYSAIEPEGWNSGFECRLIVKTQWRLYLPPEQAVYEYTYSDTSRMFSSLQDGKPAGRKLYEFMRESGYWAGTDAGKKIAPFWTDLERFYFPFGPMEFTEGTPKLKEGKWEEAAEIYNRFVNSRNKVLAGKACFNMAIVSEIANRFDLAKEWLQKADDLGVPEFYIQDYKIKLADRSEKTLQLDRQMGKQIK